jgi:two-component system sensor histidine kinase KdpD
MTPDGQNRPDPEALLRTLKRAEAKEGRGKLKIFFGMCAGVGKTYEMLQAAHEARKKNVDVVIGFVETHGRTETEALVAGLTVIPRNKIEYRGTAIEEMDIDAVLARKPALALVDELAHTNAPGSRHTKRYLDVIELLDNGIDVFTTLNVQHLESRADAVAQFTGAIVRETVPDSIFAQADEVEVIDLPPDELLRRLAEGKVYAPDRSARAVENFFRPGNLTALREMALRLAAERVDRQLRDYMRSEKIQGPWKSGQRLIVGITPSRDSVHLIRWTRRLAFTMQASWVAVFVETESRPEGAGHSGQAGEASQASQDKIEQFAKNVALARELGAEIVTTADADIAAAIVRVAREQNATQIIVGRPVPGTFRRKTLVDRLLEVSTDIDVYVTSGEPSDDRPAARVWRLPESRSGYVQYLAAGATVCLVTVASSPFADVIGYQTVSLIYLLVVALLPLRFGVGPVILAASLSALLWNYFFIPPKFTFIISRPQDILMEIAFFTVASVTGTLTARVRARERAVRSREERATALYALTNDLSTAKNQDDVARAAVENIKKFFQAETAVFLSDLDGDFVGRVHPASTFRPGEKEMGVPAWVHWNEKSAGKFTATLPFAEAAYYPLTGPRYPLGVLGVKPGARGRFTIDQEALLHNFLSQISSALEREFLNEMAKQSIALIESERLSTTLLNSISHEMRTPITALIGASEGLLNEKAGADPKLRRELAGEVAAAADRLDGIVQNLLAMTRLESGLIQPKLDWTDLRDVINAAIAMVRDELSRRKVSVDVAPDLPLLRLDFPLMEQVFGNLLRNIIVHTPETVSVAIAAFRDGAGCVVTVADDGPGFPPDALGKIFGKFYRVPGSKTGGVGLGLSIVDGFVKAHGGAVSAGNRPEGGAVFTIRLPVTEPPAAAREANDEQ